MRARLLLLIITLTAGQLLAQAPKSFRYQAFLRDANSQPLINKTLSVRISLLQGSATGTAVYSESHSAQTSNTGVVSLEIGKGNAISGTFDAIKWGADSYFIKVEMDPAGGSAFVSAGVSQLLSVPYALFSQSSGEWVIDSDKTLVPADAPLVDDKPQLQLRADSTESSYVYSHAIDRVGDSAPDLVLGLQQTDSNPTGWNIVESNGGAGLMINSGGADSPPLTLAVDRIEKARLLSNGNFGIGTVAPAHKLDVDGTVNATEFRINGNPLINPWSSDADNLFFNSGNVGIGTATPAHKLDVGGVVNASEFRINGTPLINPWTTDANSLYFNSGNVGIGTATPAHTLDVGGVVNASEFRINGTPFFNPWSSNAGNLYFNSGSVGIGTASPAARLHVDGVDADVRINKVSIKSTESVSKGRVEIKADPADQGMLYATSLDRLGDTSEDLLFGLQQPVGNSTSWNVIESWRGAGLMVSSSGPELMPLTFGIDRVEKARLLSNGYFGIGTAAPAYKLDVDGTVNATEFRINGNPLSNPWTSSASDLYFNSGNVGIGTATPAHKLDVGGVVNASEFRINGTPFINPWSSNAGNLYFSSGNVGIGTSSPAAKLHIDGVDADVRINKISIKSTESVSKGRVEIKADPADQGMVYQTSLDRLGDTSEDLLFGLQQPIGNSTSWNVIESWRGAGLMVSSSGPDLMPLTFGIDRVEKARLLSNGNFGIGTAAPAYKLDVSGTVNATEFRVNGSPLVNPWLSNAGDFYVNSGNIGIGTSSPGYRLDVDGVVNAIEFRVNGTPLVNPWSATADDLYFNSGKVGIGTATPTALLHVAGADADFQLNKIYIKSTESVSKGRLEIKADPADQGMVYSTSLDRLGDTSEDLLFGLQQPIGNSTSWNVIESWRGAGLMVSSSGPDLMPLTFGIDRVEKARLLSNGNFGIGTDAPAYKLDVNGTVNATEFLVNGNTLSNPWSADADDLYFNSGDVGIGTATPGYKLDVNGVVNATEFRINGTQLVNPWSTNVDDLYFNSGNVGLGTSSPTARLHIDGTDADIRINKISIKSTESVSKGRVEIKADPADQGMVYSTSLDKLGDTSEDLLFGLQQPLGNSTSWNIIESWRGAGLMISSSGPDLKPLTFGIDRVEKARLLSNGNFGIGTTSPASKLQVEDGDIYLNSITAGVIMKSPNGQCWRMKIDNTGVPVTTSITCP